MNRNATTGIASAGSIAAVYGMKWAIRYGADRERDHYSCRAARRAGSARHARRGLIRSLCRWPKHALAIHIPDAAASLSVRTLPGFPYGYQDQPGVTVAACTFPGVID